MNVVVKMRNENGSREIAGGKNNHRATENTKKIK